MYWVIKMLSDMTENSGQRKNQAGKEILGQSLKHEQTISIYEELAILKSSQLYTCYGSFK